MATKSENRIFLVELHIYCSFDTSLCNLDKSFGIQYKRCSDCRTHSFGSFGWCRKITVFVILSCTHQGWRWFVYDYGSIRLQLMKLKTNQLIEATETPTIIEYANCSHFAFFTVISPMPSLLFHSPWNPPKKLQQSLPYQPNASTRILMLKTTIKIPTADRASKTTAHQPSTTATTPNFPFTAP